MKKLIVVMDDGREIDFEGESLLVTTSTNPNEPTALVVRDGEMKLGEFLKWSYWKKIE